MPARVGIRRIPRALARGDSLFLCFYGGLHNFMRDFVKRFDALHADAFSYAVNFCPLDVGIFAGPVDRVIVGAKQSAGADHL